MVIATYARENTAEVALAFSQVGTGIEGAVRALAGSRSTAIMLVAKVGPRHVEARAQARAAKEAAATPLIASTSRAIIIDRFAAYP